MIAATCIEASVFESTYTQLVNCASVRTLLGVTTPDEARAFVTVLDGGDADGDEIRAGDGSPINLATCPAWFAVQPDVWSMDSTWVGSPRTWNRSASITIVLRLRADPTLGDFDNFMVLLNALGAIRSDFEAQFGTAGRLSRGSLRSLLDNQPAETRSDRRMLRAALQVDWSHV